MSPYKDGPRHGRSLPTRMLTSTRSGLWNHWCRYLTPAGLSGMLAAAEAAARGTRGGDGA